MKNLFISLFFLFFSSETLFAQDVYAYKQSPILYPGEKNQPVVQVCVIAEKDGITLKNLNFSLGAAVRSNVSAINLFYTGALPYFSPNSSEKPLKILNYRLFGKTLNYQINEKLSRGENYFWLTYDLNPNAKGRTELDADCIGAAFQGSGKLAKIIKSTGTPAVVYWFKERIIPYVRDSFLIEWNKNQFTVESMKLATDVIFFEMNAQPDASLKEAKYFSEGIEKLHKIRLKNEAVMLMFGIVNANALKNISASPQLRKKFAKNVLEKLKKYNCDGIDIDWEYPMNNTDRKNFALLISSLRKEFAGKSKIISVAANPEYYMLPIEVCDQVDFVNIMCYDRGGEHSTMNHLKNELESCRKMGIPDSKIIMGLPFYSCNSEGKRNWDSQNGYTGILGMLPKEKFSPSLNTYRHKNGELHYFNGQKLIQEKAKYILNQKSGGVMIWAYDTDVPLSDPRSLGKALGDVMKPRRN